MNLQLGSRLKNLIKSIIPIWRFFESGNLVPEIWIQAEKDSDFKKWLEPEKLHLGHLFFNPKNNYKLYCYSLTHEVARDLIEGKVISPAIEELQSILKAQYRSGKFKIINLKDNEEIFQSKDAFHV